MALNYSLYDPQTGRIEVSRSDPDHMDGQELIYLQLGYGLVYGEANARDHWVDNGVVANRPTFTIPDVITIPIGSVSTFTLPPGTQIDPIGITLEDGILELEGEMADVYELTLSLWPYVSKTVQVTVA